jgi:hypothetical protein
LADAGSKPSSSAKVKPGRRMTAAPLCEKDHIAADGRHRSVGSEQIAS